MNGDNTPQYRRLFTLLLRKKCHHDQIESVDSFALLQLLSKLNRMSYLRAAKSALGLNGSQRTPDAGWTSSPASTISSPPVTEEDYKPLIAPSPHRPLPRPSCVSADFPKQLARRLEGLQKTDLVPVPTTSSTYTSTSDPDQNGSIPASPRSGFSNQYDAGTCHNYASGAADMGPGRQSADFHLNLPCPPVFHSNHCGQYGEYYDQYEYGNYEYPQRYFTPYTTPSSMSSNGTPYDACDREVSAAYYTSMGMGNHNHNHNVNYDSQPRTYSRTSPISMAEPLSAHIFTPIDSYSRTPIDSYSRESSPPLPLVNSNGKCRQLPCRYSMHHVSRVTREIH
jgi:hypothetical protein